MAEVKGKISNLRVDKVSGLGHTEGIGRMYISGPYMEIERLFRLMQGFRRIFCRFEKLDAMYIGFIQLALVYLSIK